ncbi:hypothetical protein HL653_21400 [Sphingomonas sp. AP4-R1]|uniref:hypothetical protein n=1 Tax=Sphingomonas sp. AP4-R1 TaxID=2735134 RepID=UPI0014935CCF|nr:hypothetical protein [Sphingomonas sp. AP4-R1]QJU59960.1 hypothetical protein HL653_21400 [Sphingomonas sp. AP4-R1]
MIPWRRRSARFGGASHVRWFAAAAFFRSLVWCFSDMVLGFHAHAELDLAGELTGLLLAIVAGAGAVSDLAVGWVMRRFGIRGRAALAWQRYAMLFCGVFFVLQFLPVHDARWVIVWSILFRVTFECVAVPQAMLMAWLPGDAGGVRRLVTLNAAMGAAARLATAGLTFTIIGRYQMPFEGREALLAGIVAGLAILSADHLAAISGERQAVSSPGSPVETDLPEGFLLLALGIALHAALLYLLARLLIFTPSPGTPILMVALTVGMTIGPLAVARVTTGLKESRFAVTMSLLVVTALISLWLPGLSFVRMATTSLYGASLSASATLLWHVLAERVRRSGDPDQRSGGTAFALFAFAAKMGMVVGGWLTGRVLEGYVAGEAASRSAILTLIVGGAIGSVLLWQRLVREAGRGRTPSLQQEELAV